MGRTAPPNPVRTSPNSIYTSRGWRLMASQDDLRHGPTTPAFFDLSDVDLDPKALRRGVTADNTGALVAFEGLVRDHNEGKGVSALSYEAFAPLCLKEAAKIYREAMDLFPFHAAICRHRTGTLKIGDLAVYVAVSSAHRDEAFKACRYIIDEIKHRLPIWKKETYTDGSESWVNCSHVHQ